MDAPQTTADTPPDPATEAGGDLKSASFIGLLVTQLLGATNDNILRWLAIGIGKQYVQPGGVANILMAGTACFVLPYLLLAAPAGYLADRFSKRKVIVACKIAEMAIMVLAIVAILLGSLWMLFVIVALMGAQSALFGPSKLGSIPEMLRAEKLSAANGLMGLTTVCATMTGTAVGNVLTDVTGAKGQEWWWLSATVLIGMAAVGWGTSLLVARLPAASPRRKFPWDAPQQTWRDLKTLQANGPLMRVALGIVFFWSLGALAQLNIDQFAFEGGATVQQQVVPLLVSLVIGVGLGSVLAGIWSGGQVELGILPLGAGGMVLGAALLFLVQGTLVDPASVYTWSYYLACFFLFLLGTSAGMFDVPLAAFMQHRSPRETRGSILAASNFLTFTGILLVALLFAALRAPLRPGSLENLLTGDAAHDTAVTALWEEVSALLASSSSAGVKLDAEAIASSFPEQADLARDVVAQHSGLPLFSAGQVFLLCGAMTVPVFWYIIWRIPQASLRFFVWLATRTVYRVRVFGRENLPAEGGALLAANHVSWLDAFLLVGTSSRPLRILVDADLIRGGLAGWMARTTGAIPIRRTPKALRAALDEARAAVADGQLVCIFPEGTMTRDGRLQAFKPGLMEIVRESDVPVVPVYLDELWGSIFSFEGGRFFWKWPQRWPGRLSIWFGPPLTRPSDVKSVRDAVEQLGAEAVQQRNGQVLLPQRFLRQCRRKRFTSKVADSSGMDLTGGSLLMRTLIARRLLNRDVLAPDERFVGLLLPPSVGGVVANAAIALDGRVSANLNYTLSADVLNDCIAQAGIRHVLTSRRVMEKLEVEIDAELVYLEDFRERVTLVDKLRAALVAQLLPLRLLERLLGVGRIKGDDTFTVIFTSGSTGRPKGVLLSHTNILFNVEAIDEVIHLRSDDVVVGILPFFHSFGFSVPLWTVLGTDIKGVYHFNPLDARQVGKLCGQHRGTILLGTPTFLRSYQRRCSQEDFGTLDVVVAGAEKMPIDLAAAFEKKYGVRPVEGYGATELAPLVSVNVPPSRNPAGDEGVREGTVGRAVPGVRARVVDPDTLEDLPQGTPGMLLVTGPNVMQGYLNEPEKTADVIRDGWYVTGDIVRIDDEGFIEITGRLSRFSKIGGEMVPHVRIEEELLALLGHDDEEEGDDGEAPLPLAVTAVPDAKKGERLIVLYTQLPHDPEAICRRLADAGLPNLWIPSPESFYRVEEIPVLGTGKLDLQGVKQAAREEAEGGGMTNDE